MKCADVASDDMSAQQISLHEIHFTNDTKITAIFNQHWAHSAQMALVSFSSSGTMDSPKWMNECTHFFSLTNFHVNRLLFLILLLLLLSFYACEIHRLKIITSVQLSYSFEFITSERARPNNSNDADADDDHDVVVAVLRVAIAHNVYLFILVYDHTVTLCTAVIID